MLEMYYKYRIDYKGFIIFIKIGNFYEVFDKDALILNKIFGYKIKRIKDNIKVGFPISKIDNIISLIGNINYIIIDKDIVEKKEFSDNKYNEKDVDINNVLRNIIRTERINDYLSDNVLNNYLIENIEKIIYGKNIS